MGRYYMYNGAKTSLLFLLFFLIMLIKNLDLNNNVSFTLLQDFFYFTKK
jgi:hypothetical protein